MIRMAQNARVKDEEREVGNFLVIVAQMCFSLKPWAICFGTLSSCITKFYALKYFKVLPGVVKLIILLLYGP